MKKNIKIKTKIKIAPTTLAQRIPINNQTVTDYSASIGEKAT